MSAIPRSGRDVPVDEPTKSQAFTDDFATLYLTGAACAAEIQNRVVDCAVQQNKQVVELWKQVAGKLPWAARPNLFDGLIGTLDRFADAQKEAIKLGAEQTRVLVDFIKDRSKVAGKTADSFSKFAQQTFDQSLAAQRKVAEVGIAETKSAWESAQESFVDPGSKAVAESIRQGFDTVLNAQKDLLDTAAKKRAPMSETVGAA